MASQKDSEINNFIDDYYREHAVRHYNENGIHECTETGRRYDIASHNSHTYHELPKEEKYSWIGM